MQESFNVDPDGATRSNYDLKEEEEEETHDLIPLVSINKPCQLDKEELLGFVAFMNKHPDLVIHV